MTPFPGAGTTSLPRWVTAPAGTEERVHNHGRARSAGPLTFR